MLMLPLSWQADCQLSSVIRSILRAKRGLAQYKGWGTAQCLRTFIVERVSSAQETASSHSACITLLYRRHTESEPPNTAASTFVASLLPVYRLFYELTAYNDYLSPPRVNSLFTCIALLRHVFRLADDYWLRQRGSHSRVARLVSKPHITDLTSHTSHPAPAILLHLSFKLLYDGIDNTSLCATPRCCDSS